MVTKKIVITYLKPRRMVKFHWEFMRRDPKFKAAFDRVMEIKRQYYEGKEVD